MKIPTPALQTDLKKQNGDFLENGSVDFERISVIYGDSLPK
jgi:hypothetical protein